MSELSFDDIVSRKFENKSNIKPEGDSKSEEKDELSFDDIMSKKFKTKPKPDPKVKLAETFESRFANLKPAPDVSLQPEKHSQSFLGRQMREMKGMKESLVLSGEEYKSIETEAISQESRDSFMESLGEVATLAGQPYDVAKGAGSFILAGIPTFITGIGGAVSEMNKELPQFFAGYSNLLDMAEAAERGFIKVSEYMQPGKEQMEDILELPRETFKNAFGEELSELFLGTPIDTDLVGEIAMVPLTVAEASFKAAAESKGIKTIAKAAKKAWLDKVFVTEDNIRGALKFAGFFVGLAALHKVYKGKPGVIKAGEVKKSVIKEIKTVADKAEKIADTEILIDKSIEGAIKEAQKEIIKVEKQQLELEAKSLAEEIKKQADIEKVVKDNLKKKGKEVEEIKSGLRTAEERQVEIDRVFKEENIAERSVLEEFKAEEVGGKVKPKAKAKPKGKEKIPEFKDSADAIEFGKTATEGQKKLLAQRRETLTAEAKELMAKDAMDEAFIKATKAQLDREAIESLDILKEHPEFDKKVEPKPEPITDLDRQTGVEVPKLEAEQSPFFQNLEESNTFKKIYSEKSKAVSDDVEIFTQKLINDVNRWYHGEGVVDIAKVREGLSNLATRADELRMNFLTGADHLAWMETVREAAVWARRNERVEIESKPMFKPSSAKSKKEADALRLKNELRGDDRFYSGIDPILIKKLIKFIKFKWDKDSQSWKFDVKGMLQEIYKDPESGWWMDGQRLTPGTNRPLYLGDTKAEAIKKSVELTIESIKDLPGIKLYSGLPLDEAAKQIIKGAKQAKEYMEYARRAKRIRPIRAIKIGYEEAIREFIDSSGNIKKDFIDELGLKGYEIVQKLVLVKSANTTATNKLKQMRREVYAGLTRKEKKVLDSLVMYERLLDIAKYKTAKEFKWPGIKGTNIQLTPAKAIGYIKTFSHIENISPKRAKILRRRAESYFEWMKKPLDDLLKAELISQEEYNSLISHKYRKIKLVDIFDEKYESKKGKKPLNVYDSGVQELARGRKTDIYEPSSEIMALEVFNRSYGRITRQRANKALYELSKTDPNNPFARTKNDKAKIPSGWQRIFVFDKGERKPLYISPRMSKEWLSSSSELPIKYGRFMQFISGSATLRTFATGIEWGFALANIPKDVMHIYYAARIWEDGKWKSAYSPHLPIFLPQIGMDIARVFPDVIVRGKKTQNYFDNGGGMEFLVHQGLMLRNGKHLEPGLAKHLKALSWFGETSELMTRVAIKEHVIRRKARERNLTVEEARKDKDIQREATFVARDYMDYGQGGGITKAADNALPYINASVQATRGMWRTLRDNPKEFIYKTVEVGLTTTLIYSAMREQCPETAKALQGSMDMQNNLCIPVGDNFAFEDEKGQTRYWGFKIPLDPGQKFFKTFFEAAYDKTMGYDVDIERVTNNLFELSPVGVSTMPPTVSGAIGYLYNKDLWQNKDVWRKTKPFSHSLTVDGKWVGRSEEHDKDTHEAFTAFGKFTRASPKASQFVAEELVTSNSMWAYLMGKGYEKLTKDVPKEKIEQHWPMVLSKMPIIGRFIFVTNPYSKHAGGIEKESQIYSLERWVENRELDRLVEGYLFEKAYRKEDVKKYIRSFKDIDTRERLDKTFDFQIAIRKLPERSFWLRLRRLAPEVRANRYYERLKDANPKEHEKLMKEKSIVIKAGGVFTDSFYDELKKIRRKEE